MKAIVLRNKEKPETKEFLEKIKAGIPHVSFLEIDGSELDRSEDIKLLKEAEIFVVLGGDGTTLKAVGILSEKINCLEKIPTILSVDFGRKGFLSTCSREGAFKVISEFLNGKGTYLKKRLGEVRDLYDDSRKYFLNEVSILRHYDSSVIEFVLNVSDKQIHTRGDGFLLATSTGASAYAHSAGGPLLIGIENAMVGVFLAPERFFTPIVIGEKVMPVHAKVISHKAACSLDGRVIKSEGPFELEIGISQHEISFLVEADFLAQKKKLW